MPISSRFVRLTEAFERWHWAVQFSWTMKWSSFKKMGLAVAKWYRWSIQVNDLPRLNMLFSHSSVLFWGSGSRWSEYSENSCRFSPCFSLVSLEPVSTSVVKEHSSCRRPAAPLTTLQIARYRCGPSLRFSGKHWINLGFFWWLRLFRQCLSPPAFLHILMLSCATFPPCKMAFGRLRCHCDVCEGFKACSANKCCVSLHCLVGRV